eukprot:COSAG01_NODE_1955_length_8791_cov_6.011474_12_plen_62_part_00
MALNEVGKGKLAAVVARDITQCQEVLSQSERRGAPYHGLPLIVVDSIIAECCYAVIIACSW